MDDLRAQIDNVIERLALEYSAAPASILTESDLQCLLVSRLMGLEALRGDRPTRDAGIRGTMVHSEVPWFDEKGRLWLRPDVTILEPRNLGIFRGLDGARLPRKGFHFDGRAIIFELKFVRERTGVTARYVASIRRDLDKVSRLLQKVEREGARDELSAYFVLFSKVDQRSAEFLDLVAEYTADDRLRIIDRSSGVAWPRNRTMAPK